MGVVATRASRHRGAHHPGGGGGEEAAEGAASVLFQVLFQADAEECNYTPHLQLKIKMSLGRELQHNSPATSRVHGPTHPRRLHNFS